MLIVFDEHGGFYDHITPPSTTPPGDNPINAAPGQTPFGFDQLGVRVPAAMPPDTAETLKDQLAELETIQDPADRVVEQPLSGPQVGFAYVGLMRALSQASTEGEKAAWKKEFTEIQTKRDAARFMTRAKLKVRFGEYVPWVRGGLGR